MGGSRRQEGLLGICPGLSQRLGSSPPVVLSVASFTSSFLHLGAGSMKDGQE